MQHSQLAIDPRLRLLQGAQELDLSFEEFLSDRVSLGFALFSIISEFLQVWNSFSNAQIAVEMISDNVLQTVSLIKKIM